MVGWGCYTIISGLSDILEPHLIYTFECVVYHADFELIQQAFSSAIEHRNLFSSVISAETCLVVLTVCLRLLNYLYIYESFGYLLFNRFF